MEDQRMIRNRIPVRRFESEFFRGGIVTLEAILWLPVLLIMLLSIVEMGLLLVGTMHVSMASRVAAHEVAETPGLDAASTAAVAANVRQIVDAYLENAGYGPTASAGVRIQHNIGAGGSAVDGTCDADNDPLLPPVTVDSTRAIKVVVCAEATTLSPNCLFVFGFDIAPCTVSVATTFPYEELPFPL